MTPAERLIELEEGEVVDGPALFPGLSKREISCAVMQKSAAGVVNVELSFLGVEVGRIAGKPGENGKVVWWEDK